VPDVSDTLVLVASDAQHRDMNNDLPPGTRIGPISIPTFTVFSINGNPLVLTGPVTGDSYVQWNADLKMETDVGLPGTAFNGTIDVNGHSVTLRPHPTKQYDSPPAPIGAITGTGTFEVDGFDSKVTKPGSFSGTFNVENSVELAASMPDTYFVVDLFGKLSGGAAVIGSVSGTGVISPGTSHGSPYGTLHTKSITIDGGSERNWPSRRSLKMTSVPVRATMYLNPASTVTL